MGEAREELMRMLNEDELRDAALLVFANKQVESSFWGALWWALFGATEVGLQYSSVVGIIWNQVAGLWCALFGVFPPP